MAHITAQRKKPFKDREMIKDALFEASNVLFDNKGEIPKSALLSIVFEACWSYQH